MENNADDPRGKEKNAAEWPTNPPISTSLIEGILRSAANKGNDDALIALAAELGARLDAADEPRDSAELASTLLDVFRELCWTPRTRAEVLDERYQSFDELGSASLRHWAESQAEESGS